ncbi:MAG: phosphotransferase [Marinoscillum sp.]
MASVEEQILNISGAKAITNTQSVQTLWSGYGEIRRYYLKGGKWPSVIVKHIKWPEQVNHPRGWNTNISHQRKLKSYQVEKNWYQLHQQTNQNCRIPEVYQIIESDSEILLIMEDLNASGFTIRLHPGNVTLDHARICLTWLANFHAINIGLTSDGLWPIGTYWHLDTRPDEWKEMRNTDLKKSATAIDQHLNTAKYQTLVHGDAKLANFCFNKSNGVAAVDFQYIGKGCGMKDVAYFMSSCFEDAACEHHETELLGHYFEQLEMAWVSPIDFQLVKKEWTSLYKYAWADFYRFLDGWSPGHWKMHGYSQRLAQEVINELNQ